MTMQDRQTLARRYAAGENVTRIAVDLGMSAAAVYAGGFVIFSRYITEGIEEKYHCRAEFPQAQQNDNSHGMSGFAVPAYGVESRETGHLFCETARSEEKLPHDNYREVRAEYRRDIEYRPVNAHALEPHIEEEGNSEGYRQLERYKN